MKPFYYTVHHSITGRILGSVRADTLTKRRTPLEAKKIFVKKYFMEKVYKEMTDEQIDSFFYTTLSC